MKKKVIVFILLACFISGLFIVISSGVGLAGPPDPVAYEAYPPFLAASVPPLVMLVMGRDQKLYYEAYNDTTDLDEDEELDTTYKPDKIDYYGYFDSYKYYTYSSTNKRFEPVGVTADKKTPGGYWSGDFLNYLTMSRIDVLRKVLYGGYRSVDTATETVLERAYIPNDAHCWGKEYTDEATDGYKISDYTPYSEPYTGRRHLFANGSVVAPESSSYAPLLRVKLNSSSRIWTWVSAESGNGILGTSLVGTPDADFSVRVQVGVSTFPDADSEKRYGTDPNTVYKPIGILQRYGESDRIYFGLISGSYGNHLSGGVVRKNISSISNEINPSTGQFNYKTDSTIGGIIKTIDNFRIIGFNHSSHYWDYTTYAGPISEGQNYMWGNPVAEMMYESLRYFAGETKTAAFSSSVSDGNDRGLDLPMETWVDPYTVFPTCSKPIMLVLSDINPSYDTDQLPGSYFGGSGSLGTLSVQSEASLISANEGLSATSHYIGQSGSYTDSACSAKSISGLGEIRGLCPEEPTKMGGYYAASVAYYGLKNDLSTVSGSQTVSTYSVGLASPLPQIEIAMDDNRTITLVPFAKTIYSTGGGGVTPDRGDFQPTCAIVDFYVDSITSTSGKFRVTYEHAEQGSDYDMDALITYEYEKTSGNTIKVTISSLEATPGGGSKQHFGYIISGTDADGVYLEIKNHTQPDLEDRDYYLDTPGTCGPNAGALDTCWDDNTFLPNIKMRTFTVGDVSTATLLENPLFYAAKYGGFNEKNKNDTPDRQDEWDKDGDGVPDTYFYVVNPLELETQLNKSFAAILENTASGTAASVLANNSEGDSSLIQAFFRPTMDTPSGKTLSWLGYMQSLWVDEWGNIREDTNGNHKLDLANSTDSISGETGDVDMIIEYAVDDEGDTVIHRYTSHHLYHPSNSSSEDCVLAALGYTCPDLDNSYETIGLDEIAPLFEVGERLHQRSPDDRKIFTFIDGNGEDDDADGLIDESGEEEVSGAKWVGQVTDAENDDPFTTSGTDEVIPFNEANWSRIRPFLGVRDVTAWSYLDRTSSPNHETRAKNLINYIRGEDSADLIDGPNTRSRTLDDGDVWKLGDIVNSTPVSISSPPDSYHLIYGDVSFQNYLNHYKDRETVIYVGANDGMLHAFTSWRYDSSTETYTQPSSTTEGLGDELWAYVPQTLLPHLKFLADPEYAHSYYVDLKPKLFDAQILDDDSHYTDDGTDPDWGTILLVGLNMGGKQIWAESDFDGDSSTVETRYFNPTYICMDVTDPRNPRLLWERSYENLAMTTSSPTIVAVGKTRSLSGTSYSWSVGKWLAVFGSGPTEYDGTSNQNGYIFAIDLKTGEPYHSSGGDEWLFDTGSAEAVMNSPVSYDHELSYNVDGVYFGSVIDTNGGKVYKVDTRVSGEPSDDPTQWSLTTMFDAEGPISAPLSLSTDSSGNAWMFFGTGRYFSTADKIDTEQRYFFGVKDSFYRTGTPVVNLDMADLFDAGPYTVYTNQAVTNSDDGSTSNWNSLISTASGKAGWYNALETLSGSPSERVISKATVLGGIVFFPAYTPNSDVCGFGGSTNYYGLYYETGTAYYKQVLPGSTTTDTTGEQVNTKYTAGDGAPPPAAGFHIGRGSGGTAFLQMSTGEVVEIDVETAFPLKSNLTGWRDKSK